MQGGGATRPACRWVFEREFSCLRRRLFWSLLVCLSAIAFVLPPQAHAVSRPGGDLAPLNNPDGVLNAADILILQRIVIGVVTPNQEQLLVGDVAPLGAPDGVLNAADVVVLTRAVFGQVQLSPVYLRLDPPVLNPYATTTTANPVFITGSAMPGASINLYVGGLRQGPSATVDGNGNFVLEVALNDGANTLYVTAEDTAGESAPSNALQVSYQNEIPRNQTSTVISQNTVWSPGATNAPYIIEGALTVNNGATLTILPGTNLSFGFSASMEIHGSAQIVGTPTQPIIFSSDSPSVQVDDWRGILIHEDATNVEVRHTHIEWADYGIHDFGATNVTLANNSIENMKYGGIYVENGATTLIEANTILTSGNQYPRVDGRGIEVVSASPVIKANTISGHAFGILVWSASNPVITDLNRITGNETGIAVWGDYNDFANNPNPIVTGNSIYQNASYNLNVEGYVDPVDPFGFVELMYDYSGNWWGSADPSAISEKIYDFNRTRGSYAPVVKLIPFLGAEGGNPVAGNFINGLYTSDLSLSAGEPYVVVGSFVVSKNAVLTVSEGVRLEFAKTTSLVALGTANIIGLPPSPIIFTSYEATKNPGDWSYIALFGASSIVTFAQIEYSKYGIQVQGANTTVSNTSVSHFLLSGVDVQQPVNVIISNCQIVGDSRQGTGISISSSEARIEDNRIENTNWGIYVSRSARLSGNILNNNARGITILRANASAWADNPTIIDNRIHSNDYGIYIDAFGSLIGDPNPLIRNNEIYSNAIYNMYVQDYQPSIFVDATLNWWGTEDENLILAGLNSSQIKYSPYKNAVGQLVYSQRFAGVLSADVVIAPGVVQQVTSTVMVPQGTKLTIGAGARLEFAPGAVLAIDGELFIDSDGTSPVLFTSSIPQPQWSDFWGGLIISANNVEIHDIIVENAKTGALVYANNVTLRDSEFIGCRDKCVSYEGQYPNQIQVTAERLDINPSAINSAVVGMSFTHTLGRVAGSVIRNGDRGITIAGLSSLSVEKNHIEANKVGVLVTNRVGSTSYSPANPVVQDNNIQNNQTYGYETWSFGAYPNVTLDARYNWWGTTTSSAIEAAIRDEVDAGTSYPLVQYSPYHTSAVALPPRLNPLPAVYSAATLPVSGQAEPAAEVLIYVNNVYTTTAVADPAGEFSVSVPIGQGENSLFAVDASGAVPSYPSRSFSVVRDTQAPVISLTTPIDGTLTSQYAITFTGTVSESATLTIGGVAVTLDSAGGFSYGPVYLAEGPNAIAVIATDLAGNTTSQTVNLTLDSTPPADPNLSLISFGALSGGTVNVTGAPGAIEPGALVYLTNARTGTAIQVTAATDGSFAAAIGAAASDSLALVAADQLGNQTPWHTQTLPGSAATLALSNIQPAQGATVVGAQVRVTGTWQGPANTGISVNGQIAETTGDQFLVNDVLLEPGQNTLEITATTLEGTTLTQTQTLTRSGDVPLSVRVDPLGYGPPFIARVSLALDDSLQQISIDQDGDGGTDWSATNVTDQQIEVDLTYATAGLHQGQVHVVDSQGTGYDIPFGVILEAAVGVQAKRRNVYQQMLDRLGQNDMAGALNAFEQTAKSKYAEIFSALGTDLPMLSAQLRNIQGGLLGNSFAEFSVAVEENGIVGTYFIYLQRGSDGVWRVYDM